MKLWTILNEFGLYNTVVLLWMLKATICELVAMRRRRPSNSFRFNSFNILIIVSSVCFVFFAALFIVLAAIAFYIHDDNETINFAIKTTGRVTLAFAQLVFLIACCIVYM